MTTALIITTYNRPEYLRQCLASIEALDGMPDEIIIVDDKSTDAGVMAAIMDSSLPMTILQKDKKDGIKGSLLKGFEYALKRCDIAINLDSDAIVRPNFITRLKDLKARYPEHIVSGFNCNHPVNPILYDGGDYVLRDHCNGINMCIDAKQYETIVRPALMSESGNWDFDSTHSLPFVIAKPSVVQHIGWNNSTMGHVNGDRACDY